MPHSKVFKWRSHVRRLLKFEYDIEYKVSQEWMFRNKEYTKSLYESGTSHGEGAEICYEKIVTEFKKDE